MHVVCNSLYVILIIVHILGALLMISSKKILILWQRGILKEIDSITFKTKESLHVSLNS